MNHSGFIPRSLVRMRSGSASDASRLGTGFFTGRIRQKARGDRSRLSLSARSQATGTSISGPAPDVPHLRPAGDQGSRPGRCRIVVAPRRQGELMTTADPRGVSSGKGGERRWTRAFLSRRGDHPRPPWLRWRVLLSLTMKTMNCSQSGIRDGIRIQDPANYFNLSPANAVSRRVCRA